MIVTGILRRGAGPDADAVIFDDAVAGDNVNIRSDRALNQSAIDNTKVGVTNLGSSTVVVAGATADYSTIGGGDRNSATGDYSVCSGGFGNTAAASFSYAEGESTMSAGLASHSEGSGTSAGTYSHAEGLGSIAAGFISHSEGTSTASGGISHAEGDTTSALGISSHSQNSGTVAMGFGSHAEGFATLSSGSASHAEGGLCMAISDTAHAEGSSTTASGTASHAEGSVTVASGEGAHAEGLATTSSGAGSHSEGDGTTASNDAAHAEGSTCTASGASSHAGGILAEAFRTSQMAHGSGSVGVNTLANAQHSHFELFGQTPGAGAGETVELLYGTGGEQFILEDGKGYTIRVYAIAGGTIAAVRTVRSLERSACVRRDGGVTTVAAVNPAAAATSYGDVGAVTWTLAITAGAAPDRVVVTFGTGGTTAATSVCARVEFTEVIYP